MPKDIINEEATIGDIVYQWTVKEYEAHERNRRWYIIMGLAGLALVVFAFATANYLFALVIVLFSVIIYLHDLLTPIEVPFAITNTGVVLGRKFYRYSELKNFWIIYAPPAVKNLYFTPDGFIRHRLSIPLLNYDPQPIREFLSQYLSENLTETEEPLSDRLGRLLQLH